MTFGQWQLATTSCGVVAVLQRSAGNFRQRRVFHLSREFRDCRRVSADSLLALINQLPRRVACPESHVKRKWFGHYVDGFTCCYCCCRVCSLRLDFPKSNMSTAARSRHLSHPPIRREAEGTFSSLKLLMHIVNQSVKWNPFRCR